MLDITFIDNYMSVKILRQYNLINNDIIILTEINI